MDLRPEPNSNGGQQQQQLQPQYPRSPVSANVLMKQQLTPPITAISSSPTSLSSTTSSSASTKVPTVKTMEQQKVSVRRRCRSESFFPAHYPSIHESNSKNGRSPAPLLGNEAQYHHPSQYYQNPLNPLNPKEDDQNPSLVIESFGLSRHHQGENGARNNNKTTTPMLSIIGTSNELLPNLGGKSPASKENHAQNSCYYIPDTTASAVGHGGDSGGGDRLFESRFARNLEETTFNPASMLAYGTNRAPNRKLRPRSESEPHEMYTSGADRFRIGGGWRNREQLKDISLKRTRETISPTLEADESLEVNCSPVFSKDSPPLKILNASEPTTNCQLDDSGQLLGNGKQTLTSKQNKNPSGQQPTSASSTTGTINGTRTTKRIVTAGRAVNNRYKASLKLASATPSVMGAAAGGNGTTTTTQNIIVRKSSVSPPLLKSFIGSTSPTPSGVSTGTGSGGESVHTQDLDTETIGASDVGDEDLLDDECGAEEDDDDEPNDELNDDDALNGSITDSEDNYQTHLAAYQARGAGVKSTSCSPTPSPSLAGGRHAPVTSIGCVVGDSPKEGPLAPSLFPYVPPYITFSTHEEKGPPMPPAIHKVLKWKMTPITPIVVRKVLINTGFRPLKKTNEWIGIWGKHMKSPYFKTLRPYQKFNHLPGSFQIGRKDRCWRNLQTQMNRHGKKEFGFMPRTYIIPQDLKMLRQMWTRYAQRNCKWIIKPPASARGIGIKVVNRWSQIPKRKPLIVQRYVERPLLINGSKFDLRLYVLVTSINPLRVFMHTDGLARFASVKYSEKADTLSDRYMHLTNYSINKLSDKYSENEDADACQGHKWTIRSLWAYLAEQGVDTERLWNALRNLVLRTILAGEGPIHAMTKLNVGCRYNCYELFGIDVLLDSELVPWLLEVNISPSLHSSSTLDAHVKGPLVKALLNCVMYQIPPRISLAEQKEILAQSGLSSPLCFDKRIYVTALSKTERLKHNQYIQRDMAREEYLNSILDELTPDDVRCLLLTEDELARSAPLERILPAPNSHRYIGFTEHPRYYNRLLDAWEYRYSNNRSEGIALLQSLCAQKFHLQVPPSSLKKDCNNKQQQQQQAQQAQQQQQPQQTEPEPDSTNSNENVSQDSGIQSDPTTAGCESQGSNSAFQSQESLIQQDSSSSIGDEKVVRVIGSKDVMHDGSPSDVLPIIDEPPQLGNGSAVQTAAPEAASSEMRLEDKIKLILDDALLLKQDQQSGDSENAIIVQQ